MDSALRRSESNTNDVAAKDISQEALEHEARAKSAAREAIAKRKRNENPGESSQSAIMNRTKRDTYPAIAGCRSVCEFEKLNRIEEGSYGVVSRARNRKTGQIVALKQLKLEKEKQGFPITSLREIHTLMEARHPHIVELKEVVVGDTLSQVYLVMEFVEHDLKTLLSTMRTPFLQSEIKTLMQQILSAVVWMHTRWILHRDLKTSNLLMNNRGQIKIADFGLARLFGDPIQDMTALVVTLWYRAPELLLGTSKYDTAVDMWSVGCIFSELLLKEPLFQGKNETDQLARIFRLLGKPTESTWPGISSTSHGKMVQSGGSSQNHLPHQFRYCTAATLDLLERFLTYDPRRRISAQEALQHHYFLESPAPAHPDTFGSFPSTAAGEKRRHSSPDAPHRPRKSSAYSLEFDFP